MADSLQELSRLLLAHGQECATAIQRQETERAKASAREVLSAASKLHQRLAVLVELTREAQWLASVDRAVKEHPKNLAGQLSITDEIKRAKRSPRAGKAPE